jgi:hypothetical protein
MEIDGRGEARLRRWIEDGGGALPGRGLSAVSPVPEQVLVPVGAVGGVGRAARLRVEPPAAAARAGHVLEPRRHRVRREGGHHVVRAADGVPQPRQRPGGREVGHQRPERVVEPPGEGVGALDALDLAVRGGDTHRRHAPEGRHVDDAEPPRAEAVERPHVARVVGQHVRVQGRRLARRPVLRQEREQVVAAVADEEEGLGQERVDGPRALAAAVRQHLGLGGGEVLYLLS